MMRPSQGFLRPLFWLGLLCLAGLNTAWAGLPIQHWTHASGAQVYLVETRNLPMLDVQIDVDAGSRRDPVEQAGLAAATAQLLDSGVAASGDQPALDENALTEAWADLGAEFGASATLDRFSVRLRSLTDPALLQPALQLAARQLGQPAFPAPVWARERQRLVAAWQEAQTRPDTLSERRFSQAVYGNHPYGQEATPDTWSRIEVTDMKAFYRRYAQACDARVTLVGATDRAGADRLVQTLLAGWAAHGCQPRPALPEVAPLAAPLSVNEPFAAAQAQVLVGQPGVARSDPDYFALTVGNHILGGGGFASRLMHEIREKRGLTYGVYSSFMPGRHAGAFTVGLQTRPDQAAQAVALIQSELRRFVLDGPTDKELAEAKAALFNSFALRVDSNRKLLDNVAGLAWNGLPLNYLDTWQQQVQGVTREQVRRAFQRVLQPEKMVTVVVGAKP
ncbi:MAG TPA: pitrilysin family protein [Macromonas sp.]|nr:pitrilysin family protein [Macromonas sp.]